MSGQPKPDAPTEFVPAGFDRAGDQKPRDPDALAAQMGWTGTPEERTAASMRLFLGEEFELTSYDEGSGTWTGVTSRGAASPPSDAVRSQAFGGSLVRPPAPKKAAAPKRPPPGSSWAGRGLGKRGK